MTDLLDDDSAPVPSTAEGVDEVTDGLWPARLTSVHERIRASLHYRWWVLASVLFGLFAINVTFTVFAVALRRVAAEFHTTTNSITWVITGPLLAFGVLAPALGKAGDIWGHRRLYLIGVVGGIFCAVASAAAPTAGALIAARTLEGLEGAATGAAAMAIIFQVFSRRDRVKAMGWWSLVGAGGPVIGVTLGAPVIEAFGWRWIFVAQAPMLVIALVVNAVVLPSAPRGRRHRLDWQGALALTVAATSLLLALNRGAELGWAHPLVLGAFAAVPAAGAAFLAIERRAAEPVLPIEYFRRRNFAFPIGAQVFANFAYMGGFILAPLLLERVYGYGESKVALVVVARPLVFSITAPIAGYMAVRVGERASAVAGTLAVVASMLMFSTLTARSGLSPIIAALALSGAGLGISSPSIAASVANAVDHHSLGIASATQQLVTQVGVAAGIQVLQTVQASREAASGLVGSFSDAYLVGAGVCALAVACAVFVRSDARYDPQSAAGALGGFHG